MAKLREGSVIKLDAGGEVLIATLNDLSFGNVAGTLGVTKGGTGLTSVVKGDILISSAANTLANLALGANGHVLTVDTTTGLPTWKAIPITTLSSGSAVTGILPLANGGTNADLSSATTGGLVYKGASALAVTGTLTGILKGNGVSAPTAITATAGYNTYWVDANTIAGEQYSAITRGGTGKGSFGSNSILLGNGTSSFAEIATIAGDANKILVSKGTNAPTWSTYTMPAIITTGDMLYASSTTAITALAKGANSTVLTVNSSGNIVWATQASLGAAVDHGTLIGLGDDDHVQYIKADGTRAFTGAVVGVDPTLPTHLATKNYVDSRVDSLATGLDVKLSVKAGTISNITLSGTQTIDGIALVAGDRVLVKNQTASSQNGIYTVNAGAWIRSTDADTAIDLSPGAFTFVEQGVINGDSGWVMNADLVTTLNTDAITFVQFSGAGTFLAGQGLTKSGSTVSHNNITTTGTNGTGRAYIQTLTTDGMGHVTAFTTATETSLTTASSTFLSTTISGSTLTTAPFSSQQAGISFDTSLTTPTQTSRLNANAVLWATDMYARGSQVATVSQIPGANTQVQRSIYDKDGVLVGTRKELNFISGANLTLTVADNAGSDRVDVTIAGPAPGTTASAVGATTAASGGSAITWSKSDHIHKATVGVAASTLSNLTTNTEGSSNSLARADHTHTITGFTPFLTSTATTPASGGWYRIASSAINIGTNSGLFKIDFSGAGVMGRVFFTASSHNGVNAGTLINQLAYSSSEYTLGLTKIRIVSNTTYTGNYAYVEVYNPTALAITYSVDIVNTTGWSIVAPSTVGYGTIVGPWFEKSLICDPGIYSLEDITTEKVIRSKVATGTAPLQVTSTTLVNNLNAQYVNGKTLPTTIAIGDILYASSTTGFSSLVKGSDGQVLKLSGGLPIWSSDSNTATATNNILLGSNSGTAITYAPYTTQQGTLSFDTSGTAPNLATRLNLNGWLYTNKFNTTSDANIGGNLAVNGVTALTDLLTANGGIKTTSSLVIKKSGSDTNNFAWVYNDTTDSLDLIYSAS